MKDIKLKDVAKLLLEYGQQLRKPTGKEKLKDYSFTIKDYDKEYHAEIEFKGDGQIRLTKRKK
jgi:hypothetical protein